MSEALRPTSEWLNSDDEDRAEGDVAIRSIAVLPFENLSVEEENAFFAAGMHDEVLTHLGRIADLRVISRTSVLPYGGSPKSMREIGRELGVRAVMEGSVQRHGDQIRVTAVLVDAEADQQIWAERYDRSLDDVFRLQTDIALAIAVAMEATLTLEERHRVERTDPTEDLEAFRQYVLGMGHLNQRTEPAMRRAIPFFERAIARDSAYAEAWAALANAHTLLHDYGYRDAEDVLPDAERAIERALALNPDLAEAHASRGLLHSTRREGPAALRALQRSTELRPGYAEAHNWLSWNYQVLGFASEAVASAEKAVSLNPLSLEAQANLTGSLIADGQYDAALRQARHLHTLSLPFTDDFKKGLALYHVGKFRETIETLEPMRVTWADGGAQAVRAVAHIALNEKQQAEELLEELHELGDRFSAGLVLAALGDHEAAFAEFESIEQWHYWSALALNHYHPLLEPIRSDPRFESMMIKLRQHYGLAADGSLP